jgi:hypothetical protein
VKIILKPLERIVAVACERPSGPGWANAPVVVHIVDENNRHRTEYIQPKDQNNAMVVLFNVCNAAHIALMLSLSDRVEWEKT